MNEVNVFSKPAKDSFMMNCLNKRECVIVTSDLSGKLIKQIESIGFGHRINCSEIDSGIYLLRILSQDATCQ